MIKILGKHFEAKEIQRIGYESRNKLSFLFIAVGKRNAV